MKELDARSKWCPMARPRGDYEDEYGNNRDKHGQSVQGAICIGSDCMMWESWEYKIGPGNAAHPVGKIINEGEGDCGLKTKECNQ